jgi:hypothetical protein
MNKVIDKIGIEREYFLRDKVTGRFVEPMLYGFPYDEFGFLVELRTTPQTTLESLMQDLAELYRINQAKADEYKLELECLHRAKLDQEWVEYLRQKYQYSNLPDLTANIYAGVAKSHATGLDGDYGTAGLHVHFSRHTIDGLRVQLPLIKIIMAMDAKFNRIIVLAKRIVGEYEIKPWGWEYRSLPTDINVYSVVDFAFWLLKRDRDGKKI